jgi:hypothetical protein
MPRMLSFPIAAATLHTTSATAVYHQPNAGLEDQFNLLQEQQSDVHPLRKDNAFSDRQQRQVRHGSPGAGQST